MVSGANKLDYHLRNVTPGRDFTWTVTADIRSVNEGEACPQSAAARSSRQGRRDRPHLQARLQVLRVDGRARARPQRQGSHADHGQLRHRHRAHSHRGHRAVERRQRLLAAARPLRRSTSWSPSPISPMRHCSRAGEQARGASSKLPASTCCSMTETSAPASNSRTPTSWAFPTASMSARRPPSGQVELVARATAADRSATREVPLGEVAGALRALAPSF